jgi:hypothetical protein
MGLPFLRLKLRLIAAPLGDEMIQTVAGPIKVVPVVFRNLLRRTRLPRRRSKMPNHFETDDLELVRSRIRKIRRTAVEARKYLSRLPKHHPRAEEMARMNRACGSVVAATRPCVVSKATFPECMAVLAFTVAATTGELTKLH